MSSQSIKFDCKLLMQKFERIKKKIQSFKSILNRLCDLFSVASCRLMATADTKLGGSEESSLQSEESLRRSEESRIRSTGLVSSWESELTSIQHSLKFVLTLKEEFVCPVCRGVVLNPQQNSCGHIYCFHCLQRLL